jgi:glucuronoarabinoxylan endo-1,4-beta-xylanase
MKKNILAIITVIMVVIIVVSLFYIMNLPKENAPVAVTVTVDGSKRYQKIDGFGGSGAYYENLLRELQEPARTGAADLLFSDLGTSIYRFRLWTGIESVNDDDDPNNFNWEAFNFNTDQDQVWNAIQAKNRGVTKFIASVWSPPAWMKDNANERGGGSLLPTMYQEFAEWLAAYVIGYQTYHGINIGWIGIQNEPNYVASWETCTYTAEQLRDVIKIVGAKFSAEGISTKIVIPETSGATEALNYIPTIMADPEAAQYVDVFANHLYDTSFFNPDEKTAYLQAVARAGVQYNKPIWQTEYSYLDTAEANTFREAIFTARHIHNVLTFENGSAYLVWGLFWDTSSPGQGLITMNQGGGSYTITPKFYAVKQYSKFVTPGSRRIDVVVNNPDVLVSAYMNETNGKVTIVAINKGQNPVTATFNLKDAATASFKQYRTSTSENCAYIEEITVSNNSFNLDLPSESITTLDAT